MTADTVGGVWTYALGLVEELAPHGVEVHLATMGRPPDDEQLQEAGRSGVADVIRSSYRLEWEDDPWDDVDRAGAWLLDLEERLQPDCIHLNGYAHGCLPWRAPAVVVAHSEVVSWWWAVHGCPPPERYDAYRRAVAAGLREAAVVVAPTASVLADLERHYGLAGERLVLHNSSALEFPVVGKEPIVVGIGRFWDEAKNVAVLESIRADSPWPLVLAGPGTPRGRISRDEAVLLLARASIFVSPALYEPFGLSILEAARAGCALVLADIPSLREVWGNAAVFVPPGDEDALLAALRAAAGDDGLRRELAGRARARSTRYLPEHMASGYLDLYQRVAGQVAA